MKLTIKQAFFAMFYLLDAYFEKENTGDLGGLLGSLNPYLFDGKMPADVAIFDDWKRCIHDVVKSNDEKLETEVVYITIIKFLELYSSEFEFDFEDVIGDIKSHRIGESSVHETWHQCVEKALVNA